MEDYDKNAERANKLHDYKERIAELMTGVTLAKAACTAGYVGAFATAAAAVYELGDNPRVAAVLAGLSLLFTGASIINSCSKNKGEAKIAELEARKNSLEARVEEQ